MNYEGIDKGFLHNLYSCFNIPFAQLGAIQKIRNTFDEIVAVAECYLVANHVKSKESKKQPFGICLPVKWAVGWMSTKNEKFSSNLIYSSVSLGKNGWETFFIKVSWTWTVVKYLENIRKYLQIFRKFSYW